jgi:hypothetical protein
MLDLLGASKAGSWGTVAAIPIIRVRRIRDVANDFDLLRSARRLTIEHTEEVVHWPLGSAEVATSALASFMSLGGVWNLH